MNRIENILKESLKCLLKPKRILGWLYGAFLTMRYVDERTKFPAIVFSNKLIRLNIKKGKGARLKINGKLFLKPWMGKSSSEISLGEHATLEIMNDFIIGDDVHIKLSPQACVTICGKKNETGSGITARSLVLIKDGLQIGSDVIIAWDTFITDSDWHEFSIKTGSSRTVICDHVWISNGVKILKGSNIGANSIVACGAVVTGGDFPERTLIGGLPAKVIRMNIDDWHR